MTVHTTEIRDGSHLVALRRRQLRIEVLRGADKRTSKEFAGERVVIGTHPGCDFVLSDGKVSRQHCEIGLVSDGYSIRDLGSTNGTYIDQMRVGEVIVAGEVRLTVGDTLLRLLPAPGTVDLPLGEATSFGPLLGRSAAMRRVFQVLERVAATDSTVLITGESGTGKEVAARAVHEASARAGGPFLVVDCGALAGNLIESELFGHERGAFTGAVAARVGAFEAARGGTVLLDEIGEMPLELQSRLLGVLQRRQVQPLGTRTPRPIDVRVLAATNRDLRREVNRGSFREDLFFRLAVVAVHLPPLRDRPEDIPLYVSAFVSEWAQTGTPLSIDAATIDRLAGQAWPGNVRELRNALERAAALGDWDVDAARQTSPATAATRRDPVGATIPFKVKKAELVEEFERAYLEDLLARHGQNITQAARSAEIDRVYLLRLLDKYKMRPRR